MIAELAELAVRSRERRASAERLAALRRRKLRSVIAHAYHHVPYYNRLFREAGVSPDQIREVEDLRRIPISTRRAIRDAGDATMARGVELASCSTLRTSGSTGSPMSVRLTPHDLRTRRVIEFRALRSLGFRRRDRLALLGPPRERRPRLHQKLGFYRSVTISAAAPHEHQLRLLRAMRPTLLWVYPTVLTALLRKLREPLEELVRPRLLISSAETLDDALRERVGSALGADWFNMYGAIETGRMAVECPTHEGLHVNADHLVLECVTASGPADPGEIGAAVVTTLNVRGMPFIRYRLGDLFRYLPDPCSCGLASPLIAPPEGRESDVIEMPNGEAISPIRVGMALRQIDALDQYRLIQTGVGSLRLQLCFRAPPTDELLRSIRSDLFDIVERRMEVALERVDSFPVEGPKFRRFVPLPGAAPSRAPRG